MPLEDSISIADASTVMERHIGRRLKAMYDELVAQPIPDRLLDLLKRLDDKLDDKAGDK